MSGTLTRSAPGTVMTYGEFGRELFRQVLHADRIEAAVAGVVGDRVDLGPFRAGPGRRLATVRGVGEIGRPTAEPVPGDFVTFRVTLPVAVSFDLDLGVDLHRFRADVTVPVRLTARAEAPLVIVWDVTPPQPDELVVEVEVDKRRTAVLRRLAGVDDELRRFLVRYVERELTKEHVRTATRVDLHTVVDDAWPALAARLFRREAP